MTYNVLSAGFLSNLSPKMHHHDTMKNIIDAAAHDKGLNLEIRLFPGTSLTMVGTMKNIQLTLWKSLLTTPLSILSVK